MRRLLLSLAIMIIVAINANAQFERGTWYVNTSMSGMGISHSTYEGTNIGVGLSAGSFIDDNVALLVSTRGNYYDKGLDQFSIGTQSYIP